MRQARAAPRRGGSERAGTDVPPGAASRAAGADLRLAARHRPAQPGPGLHHLPSHPPHRHHLEAALPGRYRLLGGGVMGSIGVAGEEMGPVGAGPGNILGEGFLGKACRGEFRAVGRGDGQSVHSQCAGGGRSPWVSVWEHWGSGVMRAPCWHVHCSSASNGPCSAPPRAVLLRPSAAVSLLTFTWYQRVCLSVPCLLTQRLFHPPHVVLLCSSVMLSCQVLPAHEVLCVHCCFSGFGSRDKNCRCVRKAVCYRQQDALNLTGMSSCFISTTQEPLDSTKAVLVKYTPKHSYFSAQQRVIPITLTLSW